MALLKAVLLMGTLTCPHCSLTPTAFIDYPRCVASLVQAPTKGLGLVGHGHFRFLTSGNSNSSSGTDRVFSGIRSKKREFSAADEQL